MQVVGALVHVARTLPGVRPGKIALFGHSRGGTAALAYLLKRDDVQAVVLSSAGYSPVLDEYISDADAPILMLHGTADGSSDDGGAGITNIKMARDFEAKMKAADKSVEAVYYEGGHHNDIFTSPTRHRDELKRMASFLHKNLGEISAHSSGDEGHK